MSPQADNLIGKPIRTWVLIDMSFLAHRVKHAMRGMEFDEFPTGVIYGFFESLRTLCFDQRIMSCDVLLCFDSRHSYRKRQFPTYKQKRHEDLTEEEIKERAIMKRQMKRLRREVLPSIGFRTCIQVGVESDDLMAQAAKQIVAQGPGDRAVIISSDHDMLQCIHQSQVVVFDPNQNRWVDEGALWAWKEVTPDQWAQIKMLAGCASDEVPGIPGIAEKSAKDFLWDRLNKESKRYKSIVEPQGLSVAERNRGLVVLPHEKTKPLELDPPAYNIDAFFEWCETFGIETYLKGGKKWQWEAFFSGDSEQMKTGRQKPRERKARS